MKLPRRQFLHLAAGAAVLPASVSAQAYPSRPVKIIVGQAAGSASDMVARLVAQFLSEKLGQQFLVEVLPGATGNIATEAVIHMPPDGLHIPYKGSTPAVTDLLAGQVQVMFDVTPTSLPQIKAGKLRPLGATTTERLPFLPEVTTIDSFLKGYETAGWIGFGVPKGTPPEIIATPNEQTNAASARVQIELPKQASALIPISDIFERVSRKMSASTRILSNGSLISAQLRCRQTRRTSSLGSSPKISTNGPR